MCHGQEYLLHSHGWRPATPASQISCLAAQTSSRGGLPDERCICVADLSAAQPESHRSFEKHLKLEFSGVSFENVNVLSGMLFRRMGQRSGLTMELEWQQRWHS